MTRTVRFGLEAQPGKSALSLTVDNETLAEQRQVHSPLAAAMRYLEGQLIAEYATAKDVTTMYFDLARIGRRRNEQQRGIDVLGTVSVLAAVGNRFLLDEASPTLAVVIGTVRNKKGQLDLRARGLWPADMPAGLLEHRTTGAMRTVATDLQYGRAVRRDAAAYQKMIRDAVYADVDPASGITLETNPAGEGHVETDTLQYIPGSPTFELRGDKLDSHYQQLICLAGAVAVTEPKLLAA